MDSLQDQVDTVVPRAALTVSFELRRMRHVNTEALSLRRWE